MIVGILLAAGRGERLQLAGPPKAFRQIAKMPMWILAASSLVQVVDELVVVVPPEQLAAIEQLGFTVIGGGDTRQLSVANALRHLKTSLQDDDRVIIHDAARPFVSLQLHEQHAAASGAAMTAVEVDDTLYLKDDFQLVDRQQYLRAQTPQSFPFGLLFQAYQHQDPRFTDDISLFHHVFPDAPITVLKGDILSTKITTAVDLVFFDLVASQVEKKKR